MSLIDEKRLTTAREHWPKQKLNKLALATVGALWLDAYDHQVDLDASLEPFETLKTGDVKAP